MLIPHAGCVALSGSLGPHTPGKSVSENLAEMFIFGVAPCCCICRMGSRSRLPKGNEMSNQPLAHADEITTQRGRTTSTMTDSAKDFGDVIDLGTVSKSRRGAVATYKSGLLSLLGDALKAGKAAAVTAMAVLRSDFEKDDDFRNARQAVAAEIRKHADKLVADGTLPAGTKVSINWHPETGVPQVSIRN